MANYFIGDIQGCFEGLRKALELVNFNSSIDQLWLTGDLIGRGPNSLETMQFILKNEHCIKTVLGNHDLHFIAVESGIKGHNPKDKFDSILQHKDRDQITYWLRQQPLILELPNQQGYMTHAGLPPLWTPNLAVKMAKKVSKRLQSKDYLAFLPLMYGNEPSRWSDELTKKQQLRFTISALTRMRYCHQNGSLEFKQKGAPGKITDKELLPWFNYDAKRFNDYQWIFGHWASLMGETMSKQVIGLDTGYVWGNALTIYHFETSETKLVWSNENVL